MQSSQPKIAILHDAFLYRGGGERLVTLMAKALNADIISGFFGAGSFDPSELGFQGSVISLGSPVFAKGWRHAILKWRFSYKTQILSDYDIVIFSGNCLDALRHVRADAKKIYYCHTPPRYLFDFRERYRESIPALFRPFVDWIFDKEAGAYRKKLDLFDLIFTNSNNTHARLEHYCQKDSTILYPPVDTDLFRTRRTGLLHSKHLPDEYYLSFARLSPPKRVEMILEAFLDMPEKNLVFTYGESDPLKNQLLEKIKGVKNIFALPAPPEDEFIELITGAIATIYIPIDEDFGMSPIESMSCGVPVVGVDDGGLRETILPGKTGHLLPRDIRASDISTLLVKTDASTFSLMKNACRARALDFSLEKFVENLKKHILRLGYTDEIFKMNSPNIQNNEDGL